MSIPFNNRRTNVASHDLLLLEKQSFDILYHTQCQTPIWCGYILTEQSVNATRKYNRCSKLFPDYSIPVCFRRQAQTLWYDDYDKSHLAPHASVSTSYQASLEAAQLSNIILQRREVNQGVWRMLEHATRSYVREANKQHNFKCGSKEQRMYAAELSELMALYTPYSTHRLNEQKSGKQNSLELWRWLHFFSGRFSTKKLKTCSSEQSTTYSSPLHDDNNTESQHKQCNDGNDNVSDDKSSSNNSNNDKKNSNKNNYGNSEESRKKREEMSEEVDTERGKQQYLPQEVQLKSHLFSPRWWLKTNVKKTTVVANVKNGQEDNNDTCSSSSFTGTSRKRKSNIVLGRVKKSSKYNENDSLNRFCKNKSKGTLAICTGPLFYQAKSPSSSSSSSLNVSSTIRVRGSSESVRRRLRRLEHKELHREQRKILKCSSKLEQMLEKKQNEESVNPFSRKWQSEQHTNHDRQVNEEEPELRSQEEMEQYKRELCQRQEEKERINNSPSSSSSSTKENNESSNEVNCAKSKTLCSSSFWPSKLTRVASWTKNSKESNTENISDSNSVNVKAEYLPTNYIETHNALKKSNYLKHRWKKELPPDATFMAIWDLHTHDHIAFIVPNKSRKQRQGKTKQLCNSIIEEFANKPYNAVNQSESGEGDNNSTNNKPKRNIAEAISSESACKFELLSPILPYIVEWNELEHIFTESMCELERRKEIKRLKTCTVKRQSNNTKTLPHSKDESNKDNGKANYDVAIDMPLFHIFPIQQAKWRLRTAIPRLREYLNRKLDAYRDRREKKHEKLYKKMCKEELFSFS